MICNKCGAENADTARFCASCGGALAGSNERVTAEHESGVVSGSNEDTQEYYEEP